MIQKFASRATQKRPLLVKFIGNWWAQRSLVDSIDLFKRYWKPLKASVDVSSTNQYDVQKEIFSPMQE